MKKKIGENGRTCGKKLGYDIFQMLRLRDGEDEKERSLHLEPLDQITSGDRTGLG